jgi:hypothetical protein
VLPNKKRLFVSIMKYQETKGRGRSIFEMDEANESLLGRRYKTDGDIFIICPKEY